ncbi:MAG: nucleotidyl transferase AbiEii/AbiGii toxin family protein [Proteobacteria bacterium]|nr:nucleotidyl transferase AbiEii/AbiGii toxin family protein [Pseudomonadota bacterium]
MNTRITNMAASVRARLLQRAKADGRPFSELLQYYAMERFLYRLSRSEYADRFILKGALMLSLWGGPLTRATKDIDLLGRTTSTVDELVDAVRSCLQIDVDEDGLRFEPQSVLGEAIRLAARYHGVRVRFRAQLGTARISLQVDVGFGDVITPGAQPIEYPTLLDFEAPRLLGTTPETTIAEKFEAMVILDMANTRMKDFLDLWMLAQRLPLSGEVLQRAIDATFRRRRTTLPESDPVALTPAFHSVPAKKSQWRAYARKAGIQGSVPALDEAIVQIHSFVMPVVRALVAGTPFQDMWPPGGPWRHQRSEDEAAEHEA